MMRKVLLTVGIVLLVVVAGGAVFVASRQNLRFDATPYPNVTASTDSAVIERGRYIVRDVAPCAACHGDPAQREAYKTGADVPLSGGPNRSMFEPFSCQMPLVVPNQTVPSPSTYALVISRPSGAATSVSGSMRPPSIRDIVRPAE